MCFTENRNGKLVGVVSYNIHSIHLNYGAVLHTYAFQQYLKKNGVDSVILNYKPTGHLEHYSLMFPIFNYKGGGRRKLYEHLRSWGFGFWANVRKYIKFQRFFRKHYVKTKRQYTFEQLMKMDELEDLNVAVWVCESDVIWKLYKKKSFDDIFFLNAPFMQNCRKVAYAPSMGARKLSDEEAARFRSLTAPFNAISLREKESADYVSSLLGRDVSFVLDPVFLLGIDDYDKILLPPKERHYLLVYACIKDDKKMISEARKLADRLGLQVIEISTFDYHRFKFGHIVRSDASVEEFLGYFKYADFVVSNSFHGICFSIIFQKQFFVFQRDKTDYRMQSLIREMDCNDRLVLCDDKHIPENFSDIDFCRVEAKRVKLLRESTIYIQNNIINVIQSDAD